MSGLPFVDQNRGVSGAFGHADTAPLAEFEIDYRTLIPGDGAVRAEDETGAARVAMPARETAFDLAEDLGPRHGQRLLGEGFGSPRRAIIGSRVVG